MKNKYGESLTVEIVSGGFILTYPVIENDKDGNEVSDIEREVFSSPRKLIQKIKDVIDSLGLVAEDKS